MDDNNMKKCPQSAMYEGEYPEDHAFHTKPDVVEDMVNHPAHYMVIPELDVEAKHIIRATLGEEGYKAYCHGNMLKYLLRKKFDMEEDVAKTGRYSEMYRGID